MKVIGLYGKKGVGKDFVADCFEPAINQYASLAAQIRARDAADGARDHVGPKIVRAAFADPIKEFLVNNLGVDNVRIHGNDNDKMTLTEYRWEQMPDFVMRTNQGKAGQMTIRDLMQVFGTELCRNIWDREMWVKTMCRRILAAEADYFVITDVRFPNEVAATRQRGQVWMIKGPQRGDQKAKADSHETEKLLLGEESFDFVVSNEFEGSVEDARAGIRFQIARGLGLVKAEG